MVDLTSLGCLIWALLGEKAQKGGVDREVLDTGEAFVVLVKNTFWSMGQQKEFSGGESRRTEMHSAQMVCPQRIRIRGIRLV